MTFDVALTVYRNLKCLRVMAKGLKKACADSPGGSPKLGRILLHVQVPEEQSIAIDCFSSIGLSAEIVSTEIATMDVVMNRFAANSKAEWLLITEQDVFLYCNLPSIVRFFDDYTFHACGPVDTFHYSNPNARGHKLYGQHGRLSPEPGYFHSSLIFVKKAAISGITDPFTVREPTKMHGYGCLGGEPYYGLRINMGQDRDRLGFFSQLHSSVGYAADIRFGDRLLATHLFYSSTKEGYRDQGFIDSNDLAWLKSEEDRFLSGYLQQL